MGVPFIRPATIRSCPDRRVYSIIESQALPVHGPASLPAMQDIAPAGA